MHEPVHSISPIKTNMPSIKEFAKYKVWIMDMLGEIESNLKLPLTAKKISRATKVTHSTTRELNKKYSGKGKTQLLVFIDTTNILNEDRDENDNLKVENIIKISKELESKGYDYEHIIDANSRHRFDDKIQIDKLINEGKVKQSPYGVEADLYVLECANRLDGKIVSNDAFRDHWDKYGQSWVYNHRIACKFMRGEFIILST